MAFTVQLKLNNAESISFLSTMCTDLLPGLRMRLTPVYLACTRTYNGLMSFKSIGRIQQCLIMKGKLSLARHAGIM